MDNSTKITIKVCLPNQDRHIKYFSSLISPELTVLEARNKYKYVKSAIIKIKSLQNEKLKEFDLHIKRMDDFEKLIKFKMENKLPLGIGTELSFPNQKLKGKIERIKTDAYPNYQSLVETFFINLDNF